MKRVFVMNIKGGVGKTTIANELAYSLDRTQTPYSFFELDTQGGSPHKDALNENAVLQIADTPAANPEEMNARWARAADIVIIPVRSSTLDAHAFVSTLQAVKERNPAAQIIVVQNYWTRYRAARDFGEWLRKTAGEDVQIFPLPNSEMFVQAAAANQSIKDRAPKSKAAKAMANIVNAVRSAANLDAEKKDA